MKLYIKNILAMMLIVFASACDEDVLDLPNPQSYGTDNYFFTIPEIESSVNAVYAGLYFRGIFAHEGFQGIDALGNELAAGPSSAGETDVLALYDYAHNNANPVIEEMWKGYFRIVLRANLVFDVADRYINDNGPTEIMDRFKGEASFMRAYAYFKLVNNWGRVPIRDQYDQSGNIDAPRSATTEEVWALVESDLKNAIEALPLEYDANDVGRATKGAAVALLGKVLLYQKKYAEADAEFTKLDQGPYNYTLLPAEEWTNNFGEDPNTENNSESIFEVQFEWFDGNFPWGNFVANGNETGATKPSTQTSRPQLYGFKDWRNWQFNDLRAAEFKYEDEGGNMVVDPRANLTFYGDGEMGDSTWCDFCEDNEVQKFDFEEIGYWYKKYNNYEYKKGESNLQSGNNDRVIRFSDVLLMWAEAKLMQGDVAGGIGLINRVRSRIGAFEYSTGYSQQQAFELLKRERVLELIGEHHRFDDLRRWGIAKEVLNDEMEIRNGQRNFEDKHYLFPIPLTERDRNPGLADDVVNDWN